jgi:hypothetical protein
VRFGLQAFYSMSTYSVFNANIGAWNTASVSNMSYVCAASGPAARHRSMRARPGFDVARAGCARRHRAPALTYHI